MIQNPIFKGLTQTPAYAEREKITMRQFLLLNGFREFRFIIQRI